MRTSASLTISLPQDMEQLITEQISSGKFTSASEVVQEALKLLQERDELRQLVSVGLEQARRGELLDGEQVFDEIEREFS